MLHLNYFAFNSSVEKLGGSSNKPRTAKVGAISKAQNLKSGPFGFCETPAGCKKFLKTEGGTLWRHEKIFQKIFLNIVTVPKNVKRGPFAIF